MSRRDIIGKENIETARQLLIADTVGYIENERFAKKEAVRDLIGTLIAARNRGLSFERMAQLLENAGVPITAGTLRAYFFKLKTEKQLQEENRKHTEKLAKVRHELSAKELAENLQHAQEVAIEHVASRFTRRPRVNAFANPMNQASEVSRSVPPVPPDASLPEQAALPALQNDACSGAERVVALAAPAAAPVKLEPRDQSSAVTLSIASSEATFTSMGAAPSAVQARTIDEIATASVGMEVGELVENLYVRAGREVWCESGKPYMGLLKARQVHLLRTVGRLIAPTIGRSSGDFVAMPREL